MKRKQKFETPAVLQAVDLSLEGRLLQNSVVDNLTVRTTGQEVKEWEFTPSDDSPFNHEWGE